MNSSFRSLAGVVCAVLVEAIAVSGASANVFPSLSTSLTHGDPDVDAGMVNGPFQKRHWIGL